MHFEVPYKSPTFRLELIYKHQEFFVKYYTTEETQIITKHFSMVRTMMTFLEETLSDWIKLYLPELLLQYNQIQTIHYLLLIVPMNLLTYGGSTFHSQVDFQEPNDM